MYAKLPNLVIGFHGCDKSVHDKLVYGNASFRPSTNDYDWLGAGVYFWEQNYQRALDWAMEQAARGSIQEPAVVGAVIDLGHCLNLTDSRFIDLVEAEYPLLEHDLSVLGIAMPKNTGRKDDPDKLLRRLDRAVIEHLHARIAEQNGAGAERFEPFDSVRGLFSEADPIYQGAGFKKKTHVQICVRNPNCIKGVFEPRKPNPKWPMP